MTVRPQVRAICIQGSLGLSIALLSTLVGGQITVAQSLPLIAQTQQTERKAEADRLFSEGIQQVEAQQLEAAIAAWGSALKIYREIGDRRGEAGALMNRGNVYADLSRYEEALAAYNQVLPIYRQIKDRNGEANVLMNRGVVYADLSRYEDAIADYNQALPIYQQLKNHNSEANVLMNRGTAYNSLSRYEAAIAAYNQALPIYQQLGNRNGEALALMNRGIAYADLSRYEQAIAGHNQALSIFQQIGNRNGEAKALSNRGNAYRALSRYQEALAAFNQALPIYQQLRNRNGEALSLNDRGTVYTDLSRYQEALAAFNQALAIFQRIKNRSGEANALNNRGNAYYSLSRYEEAIAAYNQALTLYQQLGNRNGEANALNNRGNAYLSLFRYQAAIADFNQALPIYQRVKDRNGEAKALNNLGFARFKTRQLPQAEQSLRQAIALRETIRLDRLSEDNKISLFESQAKNYRTLQQVLIAQNQPEAALTISEWGRTKALVERLSQQLQPTAPQASSQAPDIKALKQIARAQNATLVEYSVIYEDGKEKQLYTWVIQPDGTVTFRQIDLTTVLPKRCASIAQLIGNSRDSIGVRSPESDWLVVDPSIQKNPCAQSDSENNFKTLHKLLIDPIADLLPRDSNQHVVFIPDQTLFLVPFPALKATNGQYLIEKHTIRTASSIQLLGKTRALKARVKGTQTLIVGNPLMPNDPTASQPKQLSNLPNAEQEALTIAPLFNTNALTRTKATKTSILQQMPSARLIHFATHGSFYDRNGFKSWLAFAPTANDPGILTAEEVAQMQLSADLVVLSACDTGRGRVTGDGVVGLSRAFIAAGVPSIIVSLWSVPDAPTAELMQEFYRQLQRNPDKAQALRQAMLAVLKTHPQPKNWAAFTLIGEAQ